MKVRLKRPRWPVWKGDIQNRYWARESLPFVESGQGTYTHRVRDLTLYDFGDRSHFAAGCWCGMSLCLGGRRQRRLVATPSEGYVVCATCEGRAIGAGQLGARVIAGKEVCYSPRRSWA